MSRKGLELVGRRFGRLVVVAQVPSAGGHRRWLCKCDCGNTKEANSNTLNAGDAQSCGCLHTESVRRNGQKNKRHGMTGTPTHNSWLAMIKRVDRDPRYAGITVCDRWRTFENFLADMGVCPAGMSIDREDNDGNYEPGNCRWATALTQTNNRSITKRLTIDGVTKTYKEWADEYGIHYDTLAYRIKNGWDAKVALTTKADKRNRGAK